MEGIFCELPNFSLVAGNHIYRNYSDPSTKNPESCLKKLYINPNEIK